MARTNLLATLEHAPYCAPPPEVEISHQERNCQAQLFLSSCLVGLVMKNALRTMQCIQPPLVLFSKLTK
jgi:hypothetical protein